MVPKRRRNFGRDWVSNRILPIVLVSRFVPGLRLPTYTTLGFLKAPVGKFACAAIVATLVWTSGLFFVSLKVGTLLMRYLGVWRWAGLVVFGLVLIAVGRVATRLYNKSDHKRTPQ
jgi:membrane protein DedA with SNARE-associated domain